MNVTFMGTGTSTGVPAIACVCAVCASSDPRDNRTRTSVLLSVGQRRVLIDASIDLRQQALREKLGTLDAVLVTHGHADHVFGLDDVRMFNFLQRAPIPVYGSAMTLSDLERTFWYVFAPTQKGGSKPQITLNEVSAPFEVAGLRVIPFTITHGTIPILGYRVGSFAYITDGSEIPEQTLPLLSGLDVLVINALRREPHPTHFHLAGALAAIERIRPRRALLTHISHYLQHESLARELPEGIEPAYDGLTIEVDHEA
ncbi:MAG TPA: MBL fold metallo-hydrolase [Candidatus Polarisedimenticolia bacterium]|nr:MBL fold metallo-hydrolase [Candidatus Polarisedimenticolia bacterium]